MGPTIAPPAPRLVETVVARAVNMTAEVLAVRRGVRWDRPIAVRVVDRPHMRAVRDVSTARSKDGVRDEAALYAALGLSGPGPDRERGDAPPLEVSGLYDAAAGWLLVADWVDWDGGRFARARDVAQVVLDRRFDLSRWMGTPGAGPVAGAIGHGDSDATLARQAVAEGDSLVQALEYIDPQGGTPPPRALGEITERARAVIVAESIGVSPLDLGRRLFVELDGLTFVARIRGRAPWAAIDDVWRRPPQSTEEILHPEKYERNERPDDIGARLPDRLRGGWRVSYRDTVGELGTRLFLARAVDEYRAERAASGWGGDRALLLHGSTGTEPGQGPDGAPEVFAAWITSWDDDTDAEDFATEATRALAARARVTAFPDHPRAQRTRIVDVLGHVYVIERRRRIVGMLFGAPARAEAVLSQLMDAATARPGHRAAPLQGRARSR